MIEWQQLVAAFHHKFGQPVHTGERIEIRRGPLRADLIDEEAGETSGAIRRNDTVETIDGLCDTIFVCLGTALEMGVDLDPYMREVWRSNMSKTPGHMRPDGKILKGPTFEPPRIAEMVADANAEIARRAK